MPEVTVKVPGLTLSHTSLAAAEVPQVNVLTNLALVKKHTRLVALDGMVVAKAREAEKALEAQKRKDGEKAKEKGAPNPARNRAQRDASLDPRAPGTNAPGIRSRNSWRRSRVEKMKKT